VIDLIIAIAAAMIRQSSILLCGACGEAVSEKAGVINLELDGMMMVGSFTGFCVAYATGNLWLSIVSAMLIGGLVGLFMSFLTERKKIGQIIAGFGLLFLCTGASNYFYNTFFGNRPYETIPKFPNLYIKGLSDLPQIGLLFQQPLPIYLAFIITILAWFVIQKTMIGLKLKACGEDPRVAASLGVSVTKVRTVALIITGMLAGLSGSLLTPVLYTRWETNMTGGRGWISIALVYVGKWNPIFILLGALLFGFIDTLQLYMKFYADWLPQELFFMLPYIVAIAVLIPISKRGGAPKSLGETYKEES